MNTDIDRRTVTFVSKLNKDKGNKELRELLDNMDLEDIWHRRNRKTRCYSYFKRNSKIASRIDLWAIKNSRFFSYMNVNSSSCAN